MNVPPSLAALYYHADAFVERTTRSTSGGPAGLMGRQVAGHQFLDAFLTHGTWNSLDAVVPSRKHAEPLVHFCRNHPSSSHSVRRLHLIHEADYHKHFTAATICTRVLQFPAPPDERFAWLRHSPTPPPVAFCGVTHTIASAQAVAALCSLLTAPFEACDALICTSHAVHAMVTTVLKDYGSYLAERFGGSLRIRPRLEVIPLGVNPQLFRPATAIERESSRSKLHVRNDDVMVLCVGRLSHHAKAHPYPLFHATEEAAKRTGLKVHLVFAGWAAHPAVSRAYIDGATQFAPSVRTSFVDGQDASIREIVWHGADIFASLPDNIQETFGLVILEAMASGLPVLASDWDGYRDLVVGNETGFRVPTYSLKDAARGATTRLLFGQTNYDHFLAECMQTFAVDLEVAAQRMTQLVANTSLREKMGEAGRERVMNTFTWSHVIRRYEALWSELAREVPTFRPRNDGPACYPDLSQTFTNYPTQWLEGSTSIERVPGAKIPNHPLTNLAEQQRITDTRMLQSVLAMRTHGTIEEWTSDLMSVATSHEEAAATVVWLLKYGVLRLTANAG